MPKFRKKPVVIEAIQYTGQLSVHAIMDMNGTRGVNNSEDGLFITTLEGTMKADRGDWVIKGVAGEIYPCKPDIFEATYEAVEE
jgi:hypothetical protein